MWVRISNFLDDHDDLGEAHAAYIAELSRRVAEDDVLASICLQLSRLAAWHVERLARTFARGDNPPALKAEWRPDAVCFIGQSAAGCFTRLHNGRRLVVLDADMITRLVLLLNAIGRDGDEELMTPTLASVMLMSIMTPRDEALPGLDRLLLTSAEDRSAVLNDLFSIVVDFLLFHELGHAYIEVCGDDFLRITFDATGVDPGQVTSIRFHESGGIYSQIPLPGTENGLLLMRADAAHWREEFGPDVFAAYAAVMAQADGAPGEAELERFADTLTCWFLMLFALGWRQAYQHAVSGQDQFDSSHPGGQMRADILIHHVNHLAEDIAPRWRSGALARLHQHYVSLWQEDLSELTDGALQYIRYAFDGEKDLGSWQSKSALEKLGEKLIDPFVDAANDYGWVMAAADPSFEPFIRTFALNDRPILLDLGRRLRDVGVRFVSEPRA